MGELPWILFGGEAAGGGGLGLGLGWAADCFRLFPRQVTPAEGSRLAAKYGSLFYEASACLDFESVQRLFHEAVREVRRDPERHLAAQPLFILEEKPPLHPAPPGPPASKQGLASCTYSTLSTANYKEIPPVAQAKVVTVKSSRAQSKRKAPTLTLLKGFKIF